MEGAHDRQHHGGKLLYPHITAFLSSFTPFVSSEITRTASGETSFGRSSPRPAHLLSSPPNLVVPTITCPERPSRTPRLAMSILNSTIIYGEDITCTFDAADYSFSMTTPTAQDLSMRCHRRRYRGHSVRNCFNRLSDITKMLKICRDQAVLLPGMRTYNYWDEYCSVRIVSCTLYLSPSFSTDILNTKVLDVSERNELRQSPTQVKSISLLISRPSTDCRSRRRSQEGEQSKTEQESKSRSD